MVKKTATQLDREIAGALIKRYYATIEYLPGGRTAIVELTDASGGWQGGQRIELPRAKHGRRALRELGYNTASTMAVLKGGTLDAFRAVGKAVAAHSRKKTSGDSAEVPCKRCKGVGYIYTTRQEACPACDKLGKVRMGYKIAKGSP